jgi:methionyl-tRNA formyltransferase
MLRTADGLAWLEAHAPEWMISVYFGYILRAEALAIPTRGTLNLHAGLLPFNRGVHPNVWSLVEGTAAGVTLHWVDAGVDTGDLAAQCEVPVTPTDTGATLYARLEDAALSLFRNAWPEVENNTLARTPQSPGGTLHRVSDVEVLDRIDPERTYKARELIDILRARTFPPYKGAYLALGDRKVYLRLEVWEEPAANHGAGSSLTMPTGEP